MGLGEVEEISCLLEFNPQAVIPFLNAHSSPSPSHLVDAFQTTILISYSLSSVLAQFPSNPKSALTSPNQATASTAFSALGKYTCMIGPNAKLPFFRLLPR